MVMAHDFIVAILYLSHYFINRRTFFITSHHKFFSPFCLLMSHNMITSTYIFTNTVYIYINLFFRVTLNINISFRAIKDSRKIHNEDSKLNEKPKRVPSWKRHLIEKKKNKIGKVVKFVALLPWQHTKCHGYAYVYICMSY